MTAGADGSAALPVDEATLEAIARALELRDSGQTPDLVELCGDSPARQAQVTDALHRASRLAIIQKGVATLDRSLGDCLGGRYRLEEVLGSGSMGVVYGAHDLELERAVAVKLLRNEALTTAASPQRFEREARDLAAIQHPHVVGIHDVGVDLGRTFFVMERVEGLTLKELLESLLAEGIEVCPKGVSELRRATAGIRLDGRHYLRVLARWAADIAAGLGAVHGAGIVHRDVKPANIFIRRDGRPAVVDLGIATRTGELLAGESPVGTAAYLAPELARGPRSAAPSVDVYGLCATLYHLACMRPPYEGEPAKVLRKMVREDPVPVRSCDREIPPDLAAIIERGMARDPKDRYATMAGLEQDLRAFLAHLPVSARPMQPLVRWGRRARRSPLVRASALVLGLVALLGGAILMGERHAERERRRFQEVWDQLPPALTLWNPGNRRIESDEDRRRWSGLLDSAVRHGASAIPARVVRAAFRWDQGNYRGAVSDMEAVAEDVGSPLARGLAEAYGTASKEGASEPAHQLLEIEPELQQDHYLRGFHVLRTATSGADVEMARQHLDLGGEVHGAGLVLCIRAGKIGRIRDPLERKRYSGQLHEDVVRFEERKGRRSALSAHVMGASLIGLGRFEEAFGVLEEGVALAPRFQGLHSNLAVAARRCGKLELAEAHCRIAIGLRFDSLEAHETLVRVLLAGARFGEALKVVESAPFSNSARGDRARKRLCAEVFAREALHLWAENTVSPAQSAARRAQGLFESMVDGDGRTVLDDDELRLERETCLAILEDDRDGVFSAVLRAYADRPATGERLKTFVDLLPDSVSAEQMQWFAPALEALAQELSPTGS